MLVKSVVNAAGTLVTNAQCAWLNACRAKACMSSSGQRNRFRYLVDEPNSSIRTG
jgi:hypothetical protein